MSDILTKIKLRLFIVDNDKDELLQSVIDVVSDALKFEISQNEIPDELSFIVEQVSIIQYNRLGAEGLEQKKLDIIDEKYITGFFAEYNSFIKDYKRRNGIDVTDPVEPKRKIWLF